MAEKKFIFIYAFHQHYLYCIQQTPFMYLLLLTYVVVIHIIISAIIHIKFTIWRFILLYTIICCIRTTTHYISLTPSLISFENDNIFTNSSSSYPIGTYLVSSSLICFYFGLSNNINQVYRFELINTRSIYIIMNSITLHTSINSRWMIFV